ncbi:MAG TPA: hypothetical protein VF438_02130 [Candidatus Paceibacterota bacterium]
MNTIFFPIPEGPCSQKNHEFLRSIRNALRTIPGVELCEQHSRVAAVSAHLMVVLREHLSDELLALTYIRARRLRKPLLIFHERSASRPPKGRRHYSSVDEIADQVYRTLYPKPDMDREVIRLHH